MIRSGAVAKVKVDGEKYRGTVTNVRIHTEAVGTTVGGLFPGGPPPDLYRTSVPGRSTVIVTIELEGPWE